MLITSKKDNSVAMSASYASTENSYDAMIFEIAFGATTVRSGRSRSTAEGMHGKAYLVLEKENEKYFPTTRRVNFCADPAVAPHLQRRIAKVGACLSQRPRWKLHAAVAAVQDVPGCVGKVSHRQIIKGGSRPPRQRHKRVVALRLLPGTNAQPPRRIGDGETIGVDARSPKFGGTLTDNDAVVFGRGCRGTKQRGEGLSDVVSARFGSAPGRSRRLCDCSGKGLRVGDWVMQSFQG